MKLEDFFYKYNKCTNKCYCILLIALMSISYRGKSSSKIYFKAKLDC